MFIAFLRIGIALALLIFYVYPAFVALASVLWFGERLDRLRWAALAISMAGVVLVVAGAGDLGSLDALGIGLAADRRAGSDVLCPGRAPLAFVRFRARRPRHSPWVAPPSSTCSPLW